MPAGARVGDIGVGGSPDDSSKEVHFRVGLECADGSNHGAAPFPHKRPQPELLSEVRHQMLVHGLSRLVLLLQPVTCTAKPRLAEVYCRLHILKT